MKSLVVWFESRRVGIVRLDEQDRFRFVYDSAWLATSGFPVSLTLPLAPEEYVGGPAHAFFANLLPEGPARDAVCSRLKISDRNDFALLEAIGGECAGALSLIDPSRSPPDPDDFDYEEIGRKQLKALEAADGVPLLLGGAEARLSLAGAQDKLPVALLDGKLHLPKGGAPSTHILKLPNPHFAHLPVNEAFVLGLAKRVGLEVVAAELFTQTKSPSLLVERYDREWQEGTARRLHQEDLCQALGVPPSRKYESEGGPSFVRVAHCIRDNVYQPLIDVRRVIGWQAFNVVAGNLDGHAKNLALTYAVTGAVRLAPFYDLVSTREYKKLSRSLAMNVGGQDDPDALHGREWIALAHDLDISERVLLDVVREVGEKSLGEIDGWKTEFRHRHGNQSILQTLPKETAKRARRMLAAL